MAELLLAGVTHYPPLNLPDREMAGLLRFALEDPAIPEHEKDSRHWPTPMQAEWADHDASARRHREELVAGFRRVRAALDDFNPDVVLIWGDDQYENFQEDVIPPYCVLCYQQTVTHPWRAKRAFGDSPTDEVPAVENVWGEPADHGIKVTGAPDAGKHLVEGLLDRGIDMAYAYKPLHYEGLAHAFLNTVMFLDYDRAGFHYPVLPVAINCYGRRVIANRGGPIHFGQEASGADRLDPPAPSPRRCFEMGAAAAAALRESPWRCAVLASSSWSHAFLTDSTWRLRPDVAADRRLYEALKRGEFTALRDVTGAEFERAGQQEMLNWCALAGALQETRAVIDSLHFVETYIFNSDKCFLLAHPGS